MKLTLRTKYLLYIATVHAVLIYLIFRWLKEDKLLFIASEVFVLISAYIAIRIYSDFRQPIEFVATGISQIRDKDFTVKFVPTGRNEVDQLINVYNLMIDQLRQERTQQMEQQFFLEKLIDASPIAILIFDFDDRIVTVNPVACQIVQRRVEQMKNKTLAEIDHPLLNQVAELKDGETKTLKISGVEIYRVQKSHFLDRGFQRSFLLIAELTSEILETEKAAYSKVIRMMAHEVNNSIGAVNSILDVTQSVMEEPKQSDLKHALQVARERNDRLNHFMRRFADVVRLPLPNRIPTDVNQLSQDVVRLMQIQAELAGISLTFDAESSPIKVLADAAQMEQVLVNVLKNAIEACSPGGLVEVTVSNRQLAVRDNGKPIPETLKNNLFNPFYSTKPTGQGIGLTLTREILMNHGFSFSLQTNAEGWTVFSIHFA
ncbi:sensor histidine kinase [Tellurirhabdus bombi]|uniref:sensor histidine kinase n=1 Tax=Tellurirhabdus bombi TaxID=2907205 RepID=UPI001F3A69A8|nr:ATP-binding protein [Tellurirhabdus bombi]